MLLFGYCGSLFAERRVSVTWSVVLVECCALCTVCCLLCGLMADVCVLFVVC